MRLLAYVRVSTDDQARAGHSLAQQPERLAAGALAHQHDLIDVIHEVDGVSGGIPLEERPGGAELLRRLKAGEADGVIVVRLERLFRDLLDGVAFFRGFARAHNVAVVSLAEHIDTSTASGRMALNLHLVFADYERDKGAERTTEVMQNLRADGRVFGHVPYGCVAVGGHWDDKRERTVDQRLVREPGRWAIREGIVAMAREQGLSLATIRRVLRDRGAPAPSGGTHWPKSTLAELIKTHDSLAHLPLQGMERGAFADDAPEAPASQGESRLVTRH